MAIEDVLQKVRESTQDPTKKYHMFTANEPVSGNRKNLDVTNKYTGEVAAKVQLATHKDIDEAISAAVKATPAMAAMASYERKAVLEKVVAELRRRSEEIAHTLTLESGKPIKTQKAKLHAQLTHSKLRQRKVFVSMESTCPLIFPHETRASRES